MMSQTEMKRILLMLTFRVLNMLQSEESPEKGKSKWDFPKSIFHGALLYRETWTKYFKEKNLEILV